MKICEAGNFYFNILVASDDLHSKDKGKGN